MKLSRRKLVGGAAALAVGAFGFEWWTLRGNLDHRRSPGESGLDRYKASVERARAGAEGVIHIGHSTHVIALGGMLLLTDPWFYDPAFGALSHEVVPAVLPSELGKLDAILITHDHADHADMRALAEMDKSALCIVATDDLAKQLGNLGFKDVAVVAKDQDKQLGALTIRGTEAIHDIYEVGYLVKRTDRCIYFAGDTALHGEMGKIATEHKPQLSILPCDGTRLTGGGLHVMRPQDAVVAAGQLQSKIIVPSHAEAYFSDPVAGTLLASTIDHAGQILADGIAKAQPGVACKVPAPGELIVLS